MGLRTRKRIDEPDDRIGSTDTANDPRRGCIKVMMQREQRPRHRDVQNRQADQNGDNPRPDWFAVLITHAGIVSGASGLGTAVSANGSPQPPRNPRPAAGSRAEGRVNGSEVIAGTTPIMKAEAGTAERQSPPALCS